MDEHGPAYPEPPSHERDIWEDDEWHRRMRATYPTDEELLTRPSGSMMVFCAVVLALMLWAFVTPAPAMDHGFNPNEPTTKWFESKIRPDSPPNSCCGKGDAYPVSRYQRNSDHTWTIWLEDGSAIKYPDGTTRDYFDKSVPIIVPDNKVNPPDDDLDNPTDVGWIFMRVSTATDVGTIYCLIIHPEGN